MCIRDSSYAAAGDHFFTKQVQLGITHADQRRSLGILVQICKDVYKRQELHRNFGEKAAFLEQLAQQLLVRKN